MTISSSPLLISARMIWGNVLLPCSLNGWSKGKTKRYGGIIEDWSSESARQAGYLNIAIGVRSTPMIFPVFPFVAFSRKNRYTILSLPSQYLALSARLSILPVRVRGMLVTNSIFFGFL